MVGRENKRTNNGTVLSVLKNNAAADYQDPVKIEFLKCEGLLTFLHLQFSKLAVLLFI